MTLNHDQPVIGVFGSGISDPREHDAVVLLAEAIHRAGAVLLSGAEPPNGGYPDEPAPMDVKDLAVWALRHLTTEDDVVWVGVGRHDHARRRQDYGNVGISVRPAWGHRRNLIEAAICDAAFAIGATSAGTASEALCCLYLGRPVTVVSLAPGTGLSVADLRRTTGRRLDPLGDGSSIDIGAAGALGWADETGAQVRTVALPTDPEGADTLVRNLKGSIPTGRTRHAFEDVNEKDGWDRYIKGELKAAGRWPA
jgi:hypothetical protein